MPLDYRAKAETTFDEDFWNRILGDVGLRLQKLEDSGGAVDTMVDELQVYGLQRIDDSIAPLIAQAQQAAIDLGATFRAASTSAVTIGTGEKTLVLSEATRGGFVAAQYLAIVDDGDADRWLLARLVSYDALTGTLAVDVAYVGGTGSGSAWTIRPAPYPEAESGVQSVAGHGGVVTVEQLSAALVTVLLANAALTGTPTAPTAAPGTATSQIASTGFVAAAINTLTNGVGPAMDTLLEISAALNDDPDFGATMVAALAGKAATSHQHSANDTTGGTFDIARLPEASYGDYRLNNPDKLLSTDQVWIAALDVPLTSSTSIAIDFNAGFNFTATLAHSTVLSVSSSPKQQTGRMIFTQDATGGRTVSFGAGFQAAGDVFPVLSTAPGAKDIVYYEVLSPGAVHIVGAKLDVQ